jgi:hypothetical protein
MLLIKMVGNNQTQLSLYAIVFLASLGIILTSHFSDLDFGIIGIISWIVFLAAIIGFLKKIFYGE